MYLLYVHVLFCVKFIYLTGTYVHTSKLAFKKVTVLVRTTIITLQEIFYCSMYLLMCDYGGVICHLCGDIMCGDIMCGDIMCGARMCRGYNVWG